MAAKNTRKAVGSAGFRLERFEQDWAIIRQVFGKRFGRKMVEQIMSDGKRNEQAVLDWKLSHHPLGYAGIKQGASQIQNISSSKAGARVAREEFRNLPRTAPVLSEPDMKQVSDAEVFAAIARQAS